VTGAHRGTSPPIPRRSPLRYVVAPLLVGGLVGVGVAYLPDPWPVVALVGLVVAGLVALLVSMRDLRRLTQTLETYAAAARELAELDDEDDA
jgi:protein-S-isoprenylcysteine O-methyltransferase Ste14